MNEFIKKVGTGSMFLVLLIVEIAYFIFAYTFIIKDIWSWTILTHYGIEMFSDDKIIVTIIILSLIKNLMGIKSLSNNELDYTNGIPFREIFKLFIEFLIKPWYFYLSILIIKYLFL